MKKMRLIALLLAAIMMLGIFAGCSKPAESTDTPTPAADTPADTTDTPAEETDAPEETATEETKYMKLQWFQGIGIDSIFEDPWIDQQSLYPYMVFDALVAYEPQNGRIVGRLASDWTESEDGLTYTITLRDDVKWHDGEPLTAEDVIFTFNTESANPMCNYRANIRNIEGYDAVANGEATELSGLSAEGNVITIKLSSVKATFMHGLRTLMILPKHLLQDVAPADISTYEAFWSKPIGTGAYKMDQVSFPDYFTLVANEDYWDATAGIKNVQFMNYAAGGNDAMIAAMIAGDLDYVFGNATNDMAVANNVSSQNPDVKVLLLSGGGTTRFLNFNLGGREDGKDKEILKDPKVRQAFDLIIDQNVIASFYSGQAVALSTLVNPASAQYNSDIPLPYQDIETAKQMLDEAGFDYSQTIDIAYYYDDQTTADIMALLKQEFAEAGVTVETTLLTGDLNTLIYESSNFDLLYEGGSHWLPAGVYGYLCSNSPDSFMGMVEERSELFDEAGFGYFATGDDAELKKLADQLQATDYQYRFTIPCYTLNTVQMYNAAHINIPADVFSFTNCTNYRFNEWSLAG